MTISESKKSGRERLIFSQDSHENAKTTSKRDKNRLKTLSN